MVATPSEGEPHSLKRFWASSKSRKCDNIGPLSSKRMGSLTVMAKARRQFSINNFRQSSSTRIHYLSLTWVFHRTLIWLTSTSTKQEYARYWVILNLTLPQTPNEIPARLLENFASILVRSLACIFKVHLDQDHSNCLETCTYHPRF